MPTIPDITSSSKSDFDLRPRCTKVTPTRKAPSMAVFYKVELEWDIEEPGKVVWPGQFDRFADLIANAFTQEDGEAFNHLRRPLTDIDCDLRLHIGAEYLACVMGASATVKVFELRVAYQSCKVKATLLVEGSRDAAPDFIDLLDSHVHLTVRQSGELFDRKAEEAGASVNPDDDLAKEAELPPEPTPKAKTPGLGNRRPRIVKATELEGEGETA
jgi:hypothetical protein